MTFYVYFTEKQNLQDHWTVVLNPEVQKPDQPSQNMSDLLSELLQHHQVELVEEAQGQSSPVRHHAARRRGVEGHLLSQ